MRIQYCSDLHLEFPENREWLQANPLRPAGDILLMAGDIAPIAQLDEHQDFFDFLSNQYDCVYWLPGNHECYHNDIAGWTFCQLIPVSPKVLSLNNMTVWTQMKNGVRLILTTLWTRIGPANEMSIRSAISDFQAIKVDGKPLTPLVYNMLHEQSLKFLIEELKKPFSGPTVVMTHHVPTLMNYPAKYKGDSLNEAFAVELYDLIESSGVDYWIYGHHHHNVPEFRIGRTKLVTNQLGYVERGEHKTFDAEKCLEL